MTVKYTISPFATQNMDKVQQTVTLLLLNVFSMVYGTYRESEPKDNQLSKYCHMRS